jgi:type IV secretion system protein VirB10
MLRSCSRVLFAGAFVFLVSMGAQTVPARAQESGPQTNGLKQREGAPASDKYQVEPGTHILLNMINSVSTKQAYVGQRIYLETAFPVMASNRIVIPQGSWVTGTVIEVKRPGRVKGRGELQVRFDSLMLPNGVTRNFNADLGSMDPRENETLKNEGGKISGPGDKKSDVGTVVGASTAGTVIGSGIGAAAGNVGRGAGIGAGAGAAAGLLGVLTSRGPDATLSKGSSVEMVLDRAITFSDSDLDFSHTPPGRVTSEGSTPPPQQSKSSLPLGLPLP